MKQKQRITIKGYILELTCSACPEQYDVFKNKKLIGYLRLRHGHFTANYPECGGKLVFSANTQGDGYFEDNERSFYLEKAIEVIQNEDEQTALDMITEKE